MGTRTRVFGLDAMRVVAISLVVLSHGVVLWPQNTTLSNVLSRTPDGVDLFFGLSGFLVGSMWLRAMHQPNWVTNFWRRWWLRTLPAYYAVLILSYVAVACGWIANDSTLPWWRFATFTQNTVEPLKGFFWESWSLTVQQWSYFLLPPLLWLASLVVPRKLPLFLLASLTLVGVGWGCRWGLADIHADAFWWDVWFRKAGALQGGHLGRRHARGCLACGPTGVASTPSLAPCRGRRHGPRVHRQPGPRLERQLRQNWVPWHPRLGGGLVDSSNERPHVMAVQGKARHCPCQRHLLQPLPRQPRIDCHADAARHDGARHRRRGCGSCSTWRSRTSLRVRSIVGSRSPSCGCAECASPQRGWLALAE